MNYWMTDRKQGFKNINARAEAVRKVPYFRAAFRRAFLRAERVLS
jgi:hypothetical protein